MSNIKITKSGFYKFSDILPLLSKEGTGVVIEDNISAIFFDDTSSQPSPLEEKEQGQFNSPSTTKERGLGGEVNFFLGEHSQVEIFGVLNNISNYKLNIISNKEGSSLKVRYLLLAIDGDKTVAKIKSSIEASHTKSDVKIISLVMDNGIVDVDGIIDIKKGIEKIKGHLIQENIFLGNTGKIKGVPTLLVASNDVEASHACKIERVSDDELFYLRSRGIGKESAISMMLEAKISDLFKCLSMVDNEFYEGLVKNILIKIK
ncbi:MAG: SufD family Fe-S cluster assembly protein [Candidatus Gracilibacteria bacterium]|nr:SufD family Fe-S cluster assembly protein [Candidatus Gracilibacteria bacterium]